MYKRLEGNGWQEEPTNLCLYGDIPYKIVVTPKEAYHQFGNSVAIPVIKRIASEIVKQLL